MDLHKNIEVILLFIILQFGQALGAEVNNYKEKTTINPDGSAIIEVTIELRKDNSNSILLPFNYKKCEELEILNGSMSKIGLTSINDTRFISITHMDFKDDPFTLKYRFKVPEYYDFINVEPTDFGNLSFQYKFTNTTYTVIESFSSNIILPENFIITSIEESTPKISEKNPQSPYELSKSGKKYIVTIKNKKLKIGDVSLIKFRFKSEHKSSLLLFFLLGAAILYLYFYRDILKEENLK